MADARKPQKADYKIQGSHSRDSKSRSHKKKKENEVEKVKAHQIPETVTVDDLVKALDQRGATGFIKVTELCSALIEEFGGLKGYVKTMKEVFDSTESGHLKARMLESQIKLITSVNKMMGEDDPVDTMTDDDLAREVKAKFEQFYGATPNGSPGADVGLGVAAVPKTDGGVGQKTERGPQPVPPPPKDGGVPPV